MNAELIFIGLGVSVPVAFFLKAQYDKFIKGMLTPALHAGVSSIKKKDVPKIENASQAAEHWLSYVNDNPDGVPHLAVIGPSGAGKTTLVTAVLDSRDGQIVVLTAKEGDRWGGIDYIGIDDDATYTTADRTFSALLALVKQRLVIVKKAVKSGSAPSFETLTIVVDDFSTLQKECKDAADMIKLVARLGRSLRVRLVMLSDSALVKAIGLEGEGETRSNFAFLRLQRGHKATIEIDHEELPINTNGLDAIAERANLAPRQWRYDDGLSVLSEVLDMRVSDGLIAPESHQTDLQTRSRLAVALIRQGVNRGDLRAIMHDMGYDGLDNNEYTAWRQEVNENR